MIPPTQNVDSLNAHCSTILSLLKSQRRTLGIGAIEVFTGMRHTKILLACKTLESLGLIRVHHVTAMPSFTIVESDDAEGGV